MGRSSPDTLWRIEHGCPQCGAPVDLHDTDRLLECAYCRVRLHIAPADELRYLLPPKRPDGDGLFWVPYWRVRGPVFTCVACEVQGGLLDVTRLALGAPFLPYSLGVRPQAMRVRFATPEAPGTFLRPAIPYEQTLARALDGIPLRDNRPAVYRCLLDHAVSLVYLPVRRTRRALKDAVLDRHLSGDAEGGQIEMSPAETERRFGVRFIATLCPRCGWQLDAERDSLVLLCRNCNRAWSSTHGRLSPVAVLVEVSELDDRFYLPFWRSGVIASGIALDSYADLVRVANLPAVVRDGWESRAARFWTPAFRAHPDQFLRMSRALTLSQGEQAVETGVPLRRCGPVTLTPGGTAPAFKAILADFATPRQPMFERLGEVAITPTTSELVYLAFHDDGRHLTRREPPLSVARNIFDGRRGR